MKKKQILMMGWAFGLILLVGCGAPPTPDIDPSAQEATAPPTRVLSNDLTDGYFQTVIPFVSSPARGLVFRYISGTNRPGNRFDIEELELSIMRASTRFFDSEKVFLQDGQYILREDVVDLLRPRRPEGSDESELRNIGLNPAVDEEIVISNRTVTDVNYLAFLVEQNFVSFNEEGESVLEGVSIGLALNPFHVISDETTGFTETLEMDESELLDKGQRIAQELLDFLRMQEGLESVPIMMGLYVLEANTSVVPGRLVTKTFIEENSQNIRNWESVAEQHFLLDSRSASRIAEFDLNLMDEFNYFQNTLKKYYPHVYGIIGNAHFVDNNLYNLDITINIELWSATERLGFHQIVGELITEFSSNYHVTVTIRSSNTIFGTVHRPANGPVSVFRNNW